MQSREEEVLDLLKTSEGQGAFLEWIGNPMTQKMLGAARDRARPRVSISETSDMSLGRSIGAHDILDFLGLPTSGADIDQRRAALMPSYGSESILAAGRLPPQKYQKPE